MALACEGEMVVVTMPWAGTVDGDRVADTVDRDGVADTADGDGVADVKVIVVGAAKDAVVVEVPLVVTVEFKPGRAAIANASC